MKTPQVPRTRLPQCRVKRNIALRLLGVLTIGTIIWVIPPPGGVQPGTWHLLAIFVATIVGIVVKPLPMGAMALLGVATTAFPGTLTINQALSGFGNMAVRPTGLPAFGARTQGHCKRSDAYMEKFWRVAEGRPSKLEVESEAYWIKPTASQSTQGEKTKYA